MMDNRIQHMNESLYNSKLLSWNLENGQIEYIKPGVFRHLNNLRELNLQHNRITLISEDTFAGLNGLKHLYLKGNRLRLTAGSFKGLTSLHFLDLANSNITTLDPRFFQGLDNLESLSLSNCSIHKIHEDAFRYLGHLRTLNVTLNPIADQDVENLTMLKQLETLYSPNIIFCCIAGLENGQCTPIGDEFSSCSDLIRHTPLKYFSLIISVFGVLCNLYRIFGIVSSTRHQEATLGFYSLWNANINLMNILYSTCFIVLIISDMNFRGLFYKERVSWIQSVTCKLVKFTAATAYQSTIILLASCLSLTFVRRNMGCSKAAIEYWSRVLLVTSWIVGVLRASSVDHIGNNERDIPVCMTHFILTGSLNPQSIFVFFCNYIILFTCFIYCIPYARKSKIRRAFSNRNALGKTTDDMMKEFAVKFCLPVLLPWMLVDTVGEMHLI